jgi:hypothetical protein
LKRLPSPKLNLRNLACSREPAVDDQIDALKLPHSERDVVLRRYRIVTLFLNCNWRAPGYSSKREFLQAIAEREKKSGRSIQRWVEIWKQRENLLDLANDGPGPMPGMGTVLDADMRAHLIDCYLIRKLTFSQCYRSLINYLVGKQNTPGCRVAHIYHLPSRATVERFLRSLDSIDQTARAWAKRWIVTFTAPTGVGKTTAVDYAERMLGFDHQVIRCKQITTRYTLLQAVALAPGEKWNTHGRNWMRASDLYDRAIERIRQRPYLLIIDEADRLRLDCFEILRDFWDDAKLPMLLVGNEILTEKLNRQHERLFRRIRVQFEQRPLREADLRKVLEFMGYTIADDEFALLWKLVGGSPGFAEALLENANEIAASQGVKRGIEALEGALRYFPTPEPPRKFCMSGPFAARSGQRLTHKGGSISHEG